jgi:hypothetical protein
LLLSCMFFLGGGISDPLCLSSSLARHSSRLFFSCPPTGMTGISFHLQCPLTSQLHGSFLTENNWVFVMNQTPWLGIFCVCHQNFSGLGYFVREIVSRTEVAFLFSCQEHSTVKNKLISTDLDKCNFRQKLFFGAVGTTLKNCSRGLHDWSCDSGSVSLVSVVVGSVHFRVFPVICHLSKKEDQHLQRCANKVLKCWPGPDPTKHDFSLILLIVVRFSYKYV